MMSAKCVQRATGIASILDAGGQTLGHREPPFDLTQQQQTAVGEQTAAVRTGRSLLSRQSVTGQAMAG
jgi:hypothetical protein